MSQLEVRNIMTENVETLRLGDTIDLAHTVLALRHIRHLPVTDEQGFLRGLVTHRDLLRTMAEIYERKGSEEDTALIPVDNMMTRELITVEPKTAALEAAEIIFHEKLGCVPVVEGGRLLGILTEADFVRIAIKELSDAGR